MILSFYLRALCVSRLYSTLLCLSPLVSLSKGLRWLHEFKTENRLTDLTTASASPAEQQNGLSETLVFMLIQDRDQTKKTIVFTM